MSQEKYVELTTTKPEANSIIRHKDGLPVLVRMGVNTVNTAEKIMYCVACVDQEATGWYLTNENTGLKCILGAASREKLLAENADNLTNIHVKELRVVRTSRTGKALVCELVN